ncbi:MAG: NUDIX domain-containing protein [Gammaproteobacteria bacterium]|nr:NUDIX domain-containing protein [Gammaproteobacteria bacterium]MDP2141053.1 NUDIX domain-containing protein [Gammaproteobacteria bacterium]MDP2348511.1 NUDIX domain-containing protein [Gammaproteobacteria bacterium]
MTSPQSDYGIDDVVLTSRAAGYRGFFAIDKIRLRHRLFAGGWSRDFERELFVRGPAAGALLYDPVLDRVVLVEQFRIGAMESAQRDGKSPWLLEIVAGIIDLGESPEELARREAEEEAGCVISAMVPIAQYYSSPGGSSELVSLFCGRVDASSAGGIHGVEEENEDIRVVVLSSDEAWQAMLDGRMNNAMTIIAMQWLAINKQALRQRWTLSAQAEKRDE